VSVPAGHVTALVGPNGAGKMTLLKLLVGLCAPSSGEAEVLGRAPEQSAEFLASIGYLAQDVPLYKRLSAEDHLRIGAHLNLDWDADAARERLAGLKIPTNRPVATLSGGQRVQVGPSLVLAKRPKLLLLDEPMAALDPLARREFLESLTAAVADNGLSVVISSHLLHDLERVCDRLILPPSSTSSAAASTRSARAVHSRYQRSGSLLSICAAVPRHSPMSAPPAGAVPRVRSSWASRSSSLRATCTTSSLQQSSTTMLS
jgi:ABC-2 type transport system ATP-binding protein